MAFPRLILLCLQLWLSTNALAIDQPFEADGLQLPIHGTMSSKNGDDPPRISKVEQDDSLCDARSRQWTGKIPVHNGNSLFYWYFESLISPERAPTLVYLPGGPGEAIATTILSGSGPCHIQLDNSSTIFNPSSWTNHFNVLYIDEVAGSGFSKIADVKTDIPSTMREVAEDIKLFMKTFTDSVFPELKRREFHLMGESFGGFLVPYVATSILDEQESQNRPEIDVKTIILTSPLIDFGYSAASYYDILCTGEVLYLNVTECATILAAVPRCEADARRCRYDGNDTACKNVGESCGIILSYWYPPKRNIVNLKKPCYSFPTCSFWAEHVEAYMNNLKTQKRLGLQGPLPLEFRHMDMEINQAFGDAMLRPNWTQFTHLLEDTSLRILIRAGELDADTPRIGNERAADSFAWYGQAAFRASPHRPWYHVPRGSGHYVRGGFFKGYDKLWLASADNAGHILDADDPEAGLYILKSWILGDFSLS